MPHIAYRSNALSICCFCPFKSFCFSYRLFRSLHSSFMRSNCARILFRHSGSIFLYSPVSLRIVLLFSFICSDTHIQSVRLRTSISVSYHSVSASIFAHSHTMTFFSISVFLFSKYVNNSVRKIYSFVSQVLCFSFDFISLVYACTDSPPPQTATSFIRKWCSHSVASLLVLKPLLTFRQFFPVQS